MIELISRNSFLENADVGSELVWELGGQSVRPSVTIAIPTYRRLDTLIEAVESAASQNYTGRYEIIVVDNDQIAYNNWKWPLVLWKDLRT